MARQFTRPEWLDYRRLKFRQVIHEPWHIAYFYPINTKGAASEIYCTAYANWNMPGPGFGGNDILLPLEDGTTFVLKGGWHTNSDQLFVTTGVDLRNCHVSRCILWIASSEERIYLDEDWVEGVYERPEILAQEMANSTGVQISMYAETPGGSISCDFRPAS